MRINNSIAVSRTFASENNNDKDKNNNEIPDSSSLEHLIGKTKQDYVEKPEDREKTKNKLALLLIIWDAIKKLMSGKK